MCRIAQIKRGIMNPIRSIFMVSFLTFSLVSMAAEVQNLKVNDSKIAFIHDAFMKQNMEIESSAFPVTEQEKRTFLEDIWAKRMKAVEHNQAFLFYAHNQGNQLSPLCALFVFPSKWHSGQEQQDVAVSAGFTILSQDSQAINNALEALKISGEQYFSEQSSLTYTPIDAPRFRKLLEEQGYVALEVSGHLEPINMFELFPMSQYQWYIRQ